MAGGSAHVLVVSDEMKVGRVVPWEPVREISRQFVGAQNRTPHRAGTAKFGELT